ncbi:MAG: hypothetical protein RLY87_96 [Chloroflexota bacterium]|jgi:3-oxoacyl-[acyl-carrier protein] reductase
MQHAATAFTGKTAIVTGINREIGAAIALMFVAAGCNVSATYYGEYARVQPIIDAASALPGSLSVHELDLRVLEAHESLVQQTVSRYGNLDFFIGNSGVTVFGSFMAMTEADYDSVFDLNLKGSYFGAQAAARQMLRQATSGRIVFSSSVTGITAMAGASIYGTSKAALRHLAAILGVELGRSGITVNAIAIGATLNERNLADDPDYAALWSQLSPVGRVGTPEDVAEAVRFLCSDAAQLVNGHTLTIDGGWTHTSPLSAGERHA